MRTYRVFVLLAITFFVVACGGNNRGDSSEGASGSKNRDVAEFYKLLDAGNISDARAKLYEVEGDDVYRCAEVLIEEYLALGEVHNAINVYERATPEHCSTYEMKHSSLYGHNDYERRVTQLLYNALIEADEFETAWKYHHLEYDSPTYAGNGGCYFNYVSDVLIHLCQQGRQAEAQQFLDKHSLWFLKNVDNGEWGDEYPNYAYDKVVRELQSIINQL